MGEPVQEDPRSVVGADRLGHDPEHRTCVEALIDDEGGGAGGFIASHDGSLHWCRPAPGRQDREVKVDPAMGRNVEDLAWQQRPIGDDRARVRRNLTQAGLELRVAGRTGSEHLEAALDGDGLDR